MKSRKWIPANGLCSLNRIREQLATATINMFTIYMHVKADPETLKRRFQHIICWCLPNFCTPLLADIFLHSHESDFIADLTQKKEHRYLDPSIILSLNNPSFEDFKHNIYPKQHEIKDTTGTVKSVSYMYLDLHLEIDGEGNLLTKLSIKKKNQKKKLWLFISYCQLSFHLWQHPFNDCIWSFHITTRTSCQSVP